MLNLHALPRSQQVLLGLGAVAIGTLLVLALTNFSSQVGTSLTGTFDDEQLPGDESPPVDPLAAANLAKSPLETPVPEGTEEEGTTIDAPRGRLQLAPPADLRLPFRRVSHIVYTGAAVGQGLRYATNGGGSWRVETAVGDASSSRSPNRMAVGTDGKIHAVYVWRRADDDNVLRYVTNAGGSWRSVDIDQARAISAISLALDQQAHAHVTYLDLSADVVKYATNMSGRWVPENIDSDRFGLETSLALDTRGVPHVSYGGMPLKYATKVSGSWQSEVIDPDLIASHSIKVDGRGGAHIAYQSDPNPTPKLMYVTNQSGSWRSETVAISGRGFGNYATLALDSAGRAHIAFLGDLTGEEAPILYATNMSGSWVIQPVTDRRFLVNPISIDVDPQGKAYISFTMESRTRHTTNASGTWVSAPVSSDVAQSGTSIRVQSPRLIP